MLLYRALVKGNSLDCYDWLPEEKLLVMFKVTDLYAEHDIYAFQAYNKDRQDYAVVSTDQIIFLDDPTELFKSEPVYDNSYKVVYGEGNKVIGISKEVERWE